MMYGQDEKPNIRRVPKKSSDRLKVPKHSKKTREQIERTSIIEKAKWELKIMELQEKMFETPVSIEFLKYIAKYFQPAHYEEVVLERKAMNICGYPLCNKETQKIKGKYKLSSSKRKIFDVTELKSYCGSDCMISSRYYASQLLDEPVYLRNFETMKEVDVIPLGVNIDEWILRENQKLNTFTERSLDSYVKSMVKTLPNLSKNLTIHEHFGDDKSILNNQPIIDKESFQYDSIEGYHYKPKTNQNNINKPSTIILDKNLINSNALSKINGNNNSNKKNIGKEKVVSSIIMNKEDADKFNALYEQYEKEHKEKEEDKNKKYKHSSKFENKQKLLNKNKNKNNNDDDKEIIKEMNKLKIVNEIKENNENSLEKENKISEKNNDEVLVEEFDKLNIEENNEPNDEKEEDLINETEKTEISTLNEKNENEKTEISVSSENIEVEKPVISNSNEVNEKNNKKPALKQSTGILKKSNSVSKENLKVRFNDDPSVKIIENKEEMNKSYHASSIDNNKKQKKKGKKGKGSGDVFYSYDVVEKSGVKKDVTEASIKNSTNKNDQENKDEEKNEKIIDETDNAEDIEDDEEKIKNLFEKNKDLEKVVKIKEMSKEEIKKKQKKRLVPTLSLFGKTWTMISRMITDETRLYLNNKISEDELNERLLVDDDVMNTRKDILITNIMKSYSSIKLEHGIVTTIEDELILLIKSFIVNESMVVLSSIEYWILTVVFLKALTKRNKILEKEISEEKWKEMIEIVEVPYYQLIEFTNLFN